MNTQWILDFQKIYKVHLFKQSIDSFDGTLTSFLWCIPIDFCAIFAQAYTTNKIICGNHQYSTDFQFHKNIKFASCPSKPAWRTLTEAPAEIFDFGNCVGVYNTVCCEGLDVITCYNQCNRKYQITRSSACQLQFSDPKLKYRCLNFC